VLLTFQLEPSVVLQEEMITMNSFMLNMFVIACCVSSFFMFGDRALSGGIMMLVLGLVARIAATTQEELPRPPTNT
jgi:hypothetical protein